MSIPRVKVKKINSITVLYLPISQALQSNRKIEEMSLQKKPALRRNYTQEKLIRSKEYSLPTLIKPQDVHHLPKRYNLQPFKLRVNQAQERKPDPQAPVVMAAFVAPVVETRPQREEILEREGSPFKSQRSQQQVPNNQSLNIQNILSSFHRQSPRKPLKRMTMAYGDTASYSAQSNESSSQLIPSEDQGQINRKLKRICRKYSMSTIPTTNTTELREVGVVEKRSNFCNKQAKKQLQRVLLYHDFLRQQAQLHDLSLYPVSSYEDQAIHYFIGSGNNHRLIKECMERRWWWREANKRKGEFVNFSWTQLKDHAFIIRNQPQPVQLSSSESLEEPQQQTKHQLQASCRTLHNHFECNKYLGSKLTLYLSLKDYCQRKGKQFSSVMLPTFYVCRFMDDEWKNFTKAYFQRLQISRIDNWDVNINKKYWIIKQMNGNTCSNKIFTTYKEIKQHVEKECKQGSRFLIQKYISKPFLFKRRKFDIRAYALVVRLKQNINVYLHQDGIISTATEPFDMADISNPIAHFTTESVQINSSKFGQYEPGNKLDFHAFQEYLNNAYGDKYNFAQQAFPIMRQAVAVFLQANSARLARSKAGGSFQLIQCEFSMDDEFRPWLIDVHTNPPLDTYCQVLEKVIPGVVEDALKHTVDVLFPPPLEWPENKHYLMVTKNREDGFVLVLQEGSSLEPERECQDDLQGVQSEREIYQDDLLMDSEGVQCEQRLLNMDYLVNYATDIQ